MIRTDIDIKDDLYGWLVNSTLVDMLSGGLYKDLRPINSTKEDITIAVLARNAGTQIQEVSVNVNIYIPDLRRGNEYIENTARLREVTAAAASFFEYDHTGDRLVTLSSQEIIKANGIDWHIINNRLRVRYSNE